MVTLRKLVERRSNKRRWVYLGCAVVALLFGILAAGMEEFVTITTVLAVRGDLLAQLHHLSRSAGLVGWPCRKSLAVGITSFCEVYPVSGQRSARHRSAFSQGQSRKLFHT